VSEPILALVGATATGKTDLGERLAEALDAEIVCADSRQVFGELDLGTGKPSAADRAARPHHLYDALALEERPSAGWFAREAARTIEGIRARGRTPLLVGGAGLYLRALREGLAEVPEAGEEARAELRREHAALPVEELRARLAQRDPESTARLGPRDRQRLSRALEVVELTGETLGAWHARPAAPLVTGEWRVAELQLPADVVAQNIQERTRWMFDHGLIDEVRALVAGGREAALRRLRAVAYDEALDLLAGTRTRGDAERRTNERTRQLAKRQRTWFRHRFHGVPIENDNNAIASVVRLFRSGAGAG
jgi:tRNA dimethylallyltransferase